MNFEETLTRLQEIVAKLESGDETLESSMKLFEEGAKLSARCYEVLDKAEQKVSEFTKIREETDDDSE